MTPAQQIKEVAGCLNAAGHDLSRAVAAAQQVSAQDGHDVAQLECAVKLTAEAWRNRTGMSTEANKGNKESRRLNGQRFPSRD